MNGTRSKQAQTRAVSGLHGSVVARRSSKEAGTIGPQSPAGSDSRLAAKKTSERRDTALTRCGQPRTRASRRRSAALQNPDLSSQNTTMQELIWVFHSWQMLSRFQNARRVKHCIPPRLLHFRDTLSVLATIDADLNSLDNGMLGKALIVLRHRPTHNEPPVANHDPLSLGTCATSDEWCHYFLVAFYCTLWYLMCAKDSHRWVVWLKRHSCVRSSANGTATSPCLSCAR